MFFVAAWIFGGWASARIWKHGRHWRPAWRLVLASFTAALFFAPSLLIGHGIFPAPAALVIILQPKESLVTATIPVAVTWVITTVVFLNVRYYQARQEKHDDTA